MPRRADEPAQSIILLPLIIACLCLGAAITYKGGFYNPVSLALLTLALIASATTFFVRDRPIDRASGFVAAGLVVQIALGLLRWPLGYVKIESYQALIPYYMCLVAAVVLTWMLFASRLLPRHVVFLLLVGVYLIVGVWALRSSHEPWLDVFNFQRDASAELLAGRNPYAMTFPNIYGADTWVYGEGVVKDGQVQFGFPYPPSALFAVLPGYLAGDVRYSHLLATALAGLLIGFSRRTTISFAAGAYFLFMPRSLYVLECASTEAFAALFLALVLWCALNRPGWLPYVLGLLIVTKQYLPLIAFPAILFYGRPTNWRSFAIDLTKALIVGAVVSLPLALWNWQAFWRSAVLWQFIQPFRHDALSFLPAIYGEHGPRSAAILAFVAALAAGAIAFLKAPRSAAGFAMSAAFIYLCFFAFNKQAFANYYFFVIAAMCCAIAALSPRPAGH